MADLRPYWLWDVELDEAQLGELLAGKRVGPFDREWLILQLCQYASWKEILKLMGYRLLLEVWPTVRARVRSEQRRRGLEFLARWIPQQHPEWLR